MKASIQRPGTLKDLAFRAIMDQLMSGELELGRTYSAQYFADRLGISRTPAREALLQLANMGFFICLDVRGFQVKQFTDKEIGDVFEARRVIETHMVTRLMQQLSDEVLDRLDETLVEMNRRAEERDVVRFLEADREFHMIPMRLAGNQFLADVMRNIRTHIAVFGTRALQRERRLQEVIQEHTAIIEALRRGDEQAALDAMIDHLAKTEQSLVGGEPKV